MKLSDQKYRKYITHRQINNIYILFILSYLIESIIPFWTELCISICTRSSNTEVGFSTKRETSVVCWTKSPTDSFVSSDVGLINWIWSSMLVNKTVGVSTTSSNPLKV
jgi:hypothetical protein